MPQIPNRSTRKGAKRSTFSEMADALYSDDSAEGNETDDDQDSQDPTADAPDDAPDGDSAARTPMQNMAESLYPDGGQDDQSEQEADGDADEEASSDEEQPSLAEEKPRPKEKASKQKLQEYEPVHTPSPDEWKGIMDIAKPMQKMTEEKDPAKALLYGHADKDYEKRTGKKGQISELQKRLGITVTGVYDTRTKNALGTAFVAMMLPWAEKAEKETGVPALVTIGQAWLESGHGLHVPTDRATGQSSNNLFGMKQRGGHDGVTSMTQERDRKTGVTSQMLQPFEAYDSLEDSVMAHAQALHDGNSTFRKNNPGYDAMVSSSEPAVWARGLDKAGYATAAHYGEALQSSMNRVAKLIAIIKGQRP